MGKLRHVLKSVTKLCDLEKRPLKSKGFRLGI